MKLEVGKFYKTRTGRIVGPVELAKIEYPFVASGETYTEDGAYIYGEASSSDIVSEYTAPISEVEALEAVQSARRALEELRGD